MQIGKKLVVVATVLTTGVAAALFFRKDASPDDSWQVGPVESPFRRRVESRVDADGAWARTTADGAARLVPSAASIEQPLSPGEAQPSFQRTFNPVGALLEPVQGVPEEPAAGAANGPSPAANFIGPLVHRIADGDTLSRLAERYLGRSERYLEIYNANRDVLASPDLLPIGATLRIPQLNSQPSAGPPAGGTIPGNAVPGGLVPVTRQPNSQSS